MQQACSSPKVIYWVGSEDWVKPFFDKLDEQASDEAHSLQRTNNHLVAAQLFAASNEYCQLISKSQVSIIRADPAPEQLEWHPGEGFFLFTKLNQMDELAQLNHEKLQTLSYFGLSKEEVLKLIQNPSIKGVDRVVPIGRALEFNPVWDGFDLLSQLSRQIVLE